MTRISRRAFLKHSLLLGTGLVMDRVQAHVHVPAQFERALLDHRQLPYFVDPLPIPPVLRPRGQRQLPSQGMAVDYYHLEMGEFHQKLHRDLPPTRLWGYEGMVPGPTIQAQRNRPVLIEWCNRLPSQHILPVDHHIHGAEADKPAVRTITHVHGMKVLPQYDGYPEEWFVAGKSKLCEYPNAQNGALYWYHDHALGITRLNVYAGLVGLYLIRDEREQPLNLPAGAYEIPLLIMDRTLDRHGQLDYPVSGDAKAPWVPESFGNIVLVNGKAFPFLEVEPRPYRLRLLNASNARFYQFSFSNAAAFQLIGTDQGLVRKPVSLSSLWLAPAERADIIVDFRPYAGQRIVLNNDAPAPAPDGDDYIPSQIMQFRVGKRFTASTAIAALPATLADVPQLQEASASKTRTMTLIEHEGPDGEPTSVLLNDMHWDMPVTEDPVLNTIEIWNLVNLTDDTHPIHLHLVKFQVLDRFAFDEGQFEQDGTLVPKSGAQAPGTDEVGWKDTVRVPPRMVTRIIIPFEGYTGRYVWHCHILEHEDNDMMRPFVVQTD